MTSKLRFASANGVANLSAFRDQSLSQPFLTLPPQTLRDYYNLIKYPVSLHSILKKVKGFQGREKPTIKKSLFQSWAALEDEMSFIWRNAREYNEDGSDIYELAGELEVGRRTLLITLKVTHLSLEILLSAAGSSQKGCARTGTAKSPPYSAKSNQA